MTRDPPKFNMQDAAWIPDEELAGKVFMIHGKRKWPGKFYGISNCNAIPTIAPKRLLPKNLPVCSRSQTFSLADMEPFLNDSDDEDDNNDDGDDDNDNNQ